MLENHQQNDVKNQYIEKGMLRVSDDGKKVEVHVSIDLPSKFGNLMKWEEARVNRFEDEGDFDNSSSQEQ